MAETPRRKLIEVALPLEVINRESAREKSIRHGHPSTLHLWWARRPLAAARAVLFAQLVDDPSSHPDRFPTEEDQRLERERLHGILERLVPWEATRDESVLEEARQEILRSTHNNPPAILDPFAGGGTIPLEAKRLGLNAYANDLNPLPVLINTVLLELVDRFDIHAPVTGGMTRSSPESLAEDLRYFAARLEENVSALHSALYPRSESGGQPLVYFWARTVTCPNPACRVNIPLVGSWKASARAGSQTYFRPVYNAYDHAYDVTVEPGTVGEPEGTMRRTGATCLLCEANVPLSYIKTEGIDDRLKSRLLALQVRHGKTRAFEPASPTQRAAAQVAPFETPWLESALSTHSQYMAPPRYGMTRFRDLFSDRQAKTLTSFVESLDGIQAHVERRALDAGLPDDGVPYSEGGRGALAYAEAMRILLALGVGRLVNRQSTLCIWNAPGVKVEQVFARQAYSMTWLYAEANPFAGASGSFSGQIDFLAKAVASIPRGSGRVTQGPAQAMPLPKAIAISTDPPYYDNVPYADLSDFFVVWLRRMLKETLPIFPTVLSPKAEELVADHMRLGGREAARNFFESGFRQVFANLAATHDRSVPMTVYYAFRQQDAEAGGTASTGWETVLEALLAAGWTINGTWPMRTEQTGGLRSLGRNALASSVVVACRLRPDTAETTDRRAFIAALRTELPETLRTLQQGAIAPVDLPQAAIGPGMAIFSRYAAVLEPDGSRMAVRSALERINEILDEVLAEQETDFDATTRFAIAWYRQHGYGTGKFGDADNLARARNTAVESLQRYGILTSRAGSVTLLHSGDLESNYNVSDEQRISTWEVLHHVLSALETDGIAKAGTFLADALSHPSGSVESDLVKELGHLLFRIAEKQGWTKDAIAFNSVVTSWPDIAAAAEARPTSTQDAFTFSED